MAGAKLAKGEYLLFLDSGDKILPTYIEKCLSIADKGYDIVYTEARYFGRKTGKYDIPKYQLLDFLCLNCITITSIIRKKLFDDVGGYDLDIMQMED